MKLNLNNNIIRIGLLALSILLLSRFFSLEPLNNHIILSEIYTFFSQILTVVYLVLYLYKKRGRVDILMFIILILIAYLILTTLIHDGNVRRIFMLYYPVVGFLCFMSYAMRKYPNDFVTAFCFLMYVLVTVNLIDLLMFKDTSTTYSTTTYFLAGKNQIGIAYAIGMAFVKDYAENVSALNSKGKALFIAVYVCIVLSSALLMRSATSIVCMVVLFGVYYLPQLRVLNIIRNPVSFIVSYSIFWVGLVLLRVHELAASLVVDVLGRDLTLTHRTLVWDEVISMVKENMFLGHGIRDSVNLFSISYHYIHGGGYTTSIFSAHNQVLQNLYEGGLCIVFLIVAIYFICTSTKKKTGNSFKSYFGSIILILVVWLAEAPGNSALLIMLGMCYYSSRVKTSKHITNAIVEAPIVAEE